MATTPVYYISDSGYDSFEVDLYVPYATGVSAEFSIWPVSASSPIYSGETSESLDGVYQSYIYLNSGLFDIDYVYLEDTTGIRTIGDPRVYESQIRTLENSTAANLNNGIITSYTEPTLSGFPTCLVRGNSYIDELNNSIKIVLKDEDGDPLDSFGQYEFASADLSFAANSEMGGDAVNFMIRYVGSTGDLNNVLVCELPAASSSYAFTNVNYDGNIIMSWSSGSVVKKLPTVEFMFSDGDCC